MYIKYPFDFFKQLLTADNSEYQHRELKFGKYAKFQLDSMIEGKATECDSQTAMDRRQVKKVLLGPSSAGAWAWFEQLGGRN